MMENVIIINAILNILYFFVVVYLLRAERNRQFNEDRNMPSTSLGNVCDLYNYNDIEKKLIDAELEFVQCIRMNEYHPSSPIYLQRKKELYAEMTEAYVDKVSLPTARSHHEMVGGFPIIEQASKRFEILSRCFVEDKIVPEFKYFE